MKARHIYLILYTVAVHCSFHDSVELMFFLMYCALMLSRCICAECAFSGAYHVVAPSSQIVLNRCLHTSATAAITVVCMVLSQAFYVNVWVGLVWGWLLIPVHHCSWQIMVFLILVNLLHFNVI